ncbi:MAG: DNA cytosine methyltransferase [Pirellulales bacterium]|nr:DNA cytosine methyltransferase [Pirellulales bacterium]
MARRGLPVISLFSGSLGLDLGLERAGFDIRVAVECDRFAAATIRLNRPKLPLIERKLEDITSREILSAAGLKKGEPVVVVGGLCCQSFSTAGQRASLADPRGMLIHEYLRVVRDTRPRFFVIENVSGMLSAAIKHRPLNKRGPGFPPLTAEEELGSGFKFVIDQLRRLQYYTVFDRVNAADFGVPQVRERLLFIGSRDGEQVTMPSATHAKEATDKEAAWVSLSNALEGLDEKKPVYINIPPAWLKYLKVVPAGGNWRDIPKRSQRFAMGAAYKSWGGRSGFYRRLDWDRPAPSLTTRPSSKATLLCHPTKLRPLSVREYARIQQFPDTWVFAGGPPQQYKQIGNAVPVGLGEAIGRTLRKIMRRRNKGRKRGRVVCLNSDLLKRIADRPRTILNPVRMRRIKSARSALNWLNGIARRRIEKDEFTDSQRNGSHR